MSSDMFQMRYRLSDAFQTVFMAPEAFQTRYKPSEEFQMVYTEFPQLWIDWKGRKLVGKS